MRAAGLLRASLKCDRPPLCFINEYGVARGLEADLLRQTASAIGVKLNIVPAGEPAPLSGPVAAGDGAQDAMLVPYYYSAGTGWLAIRVNGDTGFRDAVELVIRHLYDTGTYQQLFRNWRAPAAAENE